MEVGLLAPVGPEGPQHPGFQRGHPAASSVSEGASQPSLCGAAQHSRGSR